jgi:GDPmannose 4,6-dehydratase
MCKIMQKKKPKDYIISTGKTYSIKDFINLATAYLKLKTKWVGKGFNEKLILKKTNRPIITINSNLFRPSEVSALKGNSSKAKKDLKWSPKTNLKKLVKIMIDEELLHS